MHRIRKANLAAFELQYMCRSGVGLGGIFSPEHFVYYEDLPHDVFWWQGVDLAIGQKDHHDFFVHVTIAMQRSTKIPYLITYRKAHLPFDQQVVMIKKQWDAYADKPIVRVCVERNAYQDALRQQLKVAYPEVRCVGIWTHKDKITRAQNRAFWFTDHPLHIPRGNNAIVRLLCGFPHLKGSKDVFDAIDFAVTKGLRGARKRREAEPGLL
jgi:phage terminase large subunit-like protein